MSLPLLLLHGFSGAPESFSELDLGERDVYAPLLLGHSGSERAPGQAPARDERLPDPDLSKQLGRVMSGEEREVPGSFEAEVDRIAQWAHSRGFASGQLLGYSLGGRLALSLLVRHGALFRSAVLIGTHPGIALADEREQRRSLDRARARDVLRMGVDDYMTGWEHNPLFASQARLPKAIRTKQARVRRSHTPSGLAASLVATGLGVMPDYRPLLGTISCPVLLVTGEHDPKFERLAMSMLPDMKEGSHSIIAGAGHNPILEQPTRVSRLLRAKP